MRRTAPVVLRGVTAVIAVAALAGGLLVGATNTTNTSGNTSRNPSGNTPGTAGTSSPVLKSVAKKRKCKVSAKLVPSCGLWWGVSPGMHNNRHAGTRDFERQMGARVDLYKAYHFANDLFPTRRERAIANQKGHHRLLLLDYVPDGQYNWAEVAAGRHDRQLIKEARYLRKHFKKKLFISIHHEPEDEVRQSPGSGYRAQDFAAMFRHVVDVFRAQRVTNVVWVYNIMGIQSMGVQPWFPALWPGKKYVDWIAGDIYGCFSAKLCRSFAKSSMNQRFSRNAPWLGFYRWATRTHPGKPLMLSEWAAFTNAGEAARVKYLRTVRHQLVKFPRLKALTYWNSNRSPRGDPHLVPGTTASRVVSRLARSSFFAQKVR